MRAKKTFWHRRPGMLSDHAARFQKEEDGSLIAFGVILLLMLLGIAGMAVDIIHVETTRTQIQNTLDRAVLAAANLNHEEDAEAIVKDYFAKADLSEYLNDDIQVAETKAFGTTSFRSVKATASADVNTLFLKLAGIDDITTGGVSAAEEGITDLEISLVVDVSGSMGSTSSSGKSKIYELREAAKDFAYYMQCNPDAERDSGTGCSVTDGKVSITLIPFSEQVNVGETLLEQFNNINLTSVDVTDEGKEDSCAPNCVSYCTTFKDQDFRTNDIVAWKSDSPNYQLQRTGMFDARSSSSDKTPTNTTCRKDSWRQIRPFVEDHNDIYSYIDALRTGGNTSADIGMKWASNLLNPDMRDIVTNLTATSDGNGGKVVDPLFSGRPYAYDQMYSMKVIVLMSDGQNTTEYYLKDGYRDGPSGVYQWSEDSDEKYMSIYNDDMSKYYWLYDRNWHDEPYGDDMVETTSWEEQYTCSDQWVEERSCYRDRWGRRKCTSNWVYKEVCSNQWVETTKTEDRVGNAVELSFPELWNIKTTAWYNQWYWLGDPDGSNGTSTKNTRLNDICTAAKNTDKSILIYTIGFEVSEASDAVLSACATTAKGHYFKANGSNLAEVFGTIASSINQLRLTQ